MLKTLALSSGLILAGIAAQAATVTFGQPNWTDQDGVVSGLQYNVVIDDTTTAGAYHFDVSIDAVSTLTGDALVLAFDSTFDEATAFTVDNFSSNTGDTVDQICYDNDRCGGGGNFRGGSLGGPFDMQIRIGGSGSSGGLNTAFSFDLTYVGTNPATLPGLQGFTFTRAGMRVQTVGDAPDGGNDSLKIFNATPEFDDPKVIGDVPLPAAGWMLLAAFGGMAALRRRKTA